MARTRTFPLVGGLLNATPFCGYKVAEINVRLLFRQEKSAKG